MYGNNVSDMLSTFDWSFNQIFTIFYDRIKDFNSKKLLEELKNNINASEGMKRILWKTYFFIVIALFFDLDSKHWVIIYLLYALFLPTSKKSSLDSNGKKSTITFSIKDSQNSFIMVASTITALEEMIKIRKSSNNPIQPCLLIVGTILNPTQILVYFDEIKYKFFLLLKL